jgi:hypothetical protein
VLATPLGTALGGPLTAWLGAQHTLLASAAATIASGLAATALLTTRRRELARSEAGAAPAVARSPALTGPERIPAPPVGVSAARTTMRV